MTVRERPPLRLTTEAVTPSGRHYRWAADAPDPRDRPSARTFSDTMPGGFSDSTVTLPRRASAADADLDPLTSIRHVGAGGDIAWEGRLERAPRTSGDQVSVSPGLVGWQAALADDKSARMIGIDRDLGHWGGPSRQRLVNLLAATGSQMGEPQVLPDAATGAPALRVGWTGAWSSISPTTDAWYDAGDGNLIGRLRATWTRVGGPNPSDANWFWRAFLSSDDLVTVADGGTNLAAAGPGTIDIAATGDRRHALLQIFYNSTATAGVDGFPYAIDWTNVRVFGDHGLTIRGSTPATEGFYASDLVAHIVRRFAPLLTFTEGSDGTIRPSTFIIPQFASPDATNAGELVRQATRFGLEDWAVWDNKTFYWHPRGDRGRRWRARTGQIKLEETGPQIDRLWESVIVQYRDVDGSTRTVGPTGSGAGTESADLKDADPENPANKLGIVRRDMLQAGTLTAAAAIEIGRRFLQEQKLLDRSGRATITGHVTDDRGVLHPYWRVRSGDYISVTDAADTSYRRIVNTTKDEATFSCSVDLDAPPEGLAALLERLGVVLAPLGVG